MVSRAALLLLAGFIASSLALQVAPDSPCAPLCIDEDDLDKSDPEASNTKGKDITCNDSDYLSKPAGQKFQKCMTCLQDSGHSKGSETDQQWFLYNMRYSIDYCIFGFPNATDVGSNPCQTSTACGALEKVLLAGDLDPEKTGNFAYCDADDGSSLVSDEFNKCLACIRAGGDHRYLTNYLIALEAACRQKPTPGNTILLNDTVFAATQVQRVDPSATGTTESKLKLPATTIVAITISGIVVFLLALGCIYMQYRRGVNRRNPKRGIRAGRRTVSSLSFRCRAALTPLGGRFSMHEGGTHLNDDEKMARFVTVQEEYEFDEKKELQERDRLEKERQQRLETEFQRRQRETERTGAAAALEKPWKQSSTAPSSKPAQAIQPVRKAPPVSAHSPTSARPNLWNPHNAIQSFEGLARSSSTSSKASSTRTPSTRVAPGGRPKDTLSTIKTSLPAAPPQARFSPQSDYETPTSAQSSAPLLPFRPYNPADFAPSSPSVGPVAYSPVSSVATPMGVERRFFPAASPIMVNMGSPLMKQSGWPLPAGAARPPAQNQNPVGPEREYYRGYAGRKPSGSPIDTRVLQTAFPGPPKR